MSSILRFWACFQLLKKRDFRLITFLRGVNTIFCSGALLCNLNNNNGRRVNSSNSTRIVMAVSNDLLTDQRVMRHIGALREVGYEVTTVCRTDLPVEKCEV